MKNSPYYISPAGREPTTSRTPRLHNKQGVPRPTRSAIGRRYNINVKNSDRFWSYDKWSYFVSVNQKYNVIKSESVQTFLGFTVADRGGGGGAPSLPKMYTSMYTFFSIYTKYIINTLTKYEF